ncbi:32 kda heat shock protein-related [Anaeramoeba flamelloides]|uniref:32 kDa heat shock protein-related n=1 Tax=Anaeramoeba flamelloides TaxID=1746091 RepID=A0AAV7YDN9_9EUKA|nr:32 kda heat shock protein-related [Anaeramoeba flamelloides]
MSTQPTTKTSLVKIKIYYKEEIRRFSIGSDLTLKAFNKIVQHLFNLRSNFLDQYIIEYVSPDSEVMFVNSQIILEEMIKEYQKNETCLHLNLKSIEKSSQSLSNESSEGNLFLLSDDDDEEEKNEEQKEGEITEEIIKEEFLKFYRSKKERIQAQQIRQFLLFCIETDGLDLVECPPDFPTKIFNKMITVIKTVLRKLKGYIQNEEFIPWLKYVGPDLMANILKVLEQGRKEAKKCLVKCEAIVDVGNFTQEEKKELMSVIKIFIVRASRYVDKYSKYTKQKILRSVFLVPFYAATGNVLAPLKEYSKIAPKIFSKYIALFVKSGVISSFFLEKIHSDKQAEENRIWSPQYKWKNMDAYKEKIKTKMEKEFKKEIKKELKKNNKNQNKKFLKEDLNSNFEKDVIQPMIQFQFQFYQAYQKWLKNENQKEKNLNKNEEELNEKSKLQGPILKNEEIELFDESEN